MLWCLSVKRNYRMMPSGNTELHIRESGIELLSQNRDDRVLRIEMIGIDQVEPQLSSFKELVVFYTGQVFAPNGGFVI